jgi:hypothetical protein
MRPVPSLPVPVRRHGHTRAPAGGRSARSPALARRGPPLLRRRGIPGTLPALAHAQGLILTADGATGQARSELEAAVDAWDDLGRIWEGIWARIDLARCHRRSNQRVEAQREARI